LIVRSDRKRLRRLALLLSPLSIAPRLCLATPQPESSPAQTSAAKADDPFQAALLALRDNHVQAALDALTRAEREHPEDPRVRNFRGVVLARLNRDPEAAGEYREAIRLDPAMEDAYRNLGFLQWTEHHLQDARKSLLEALALKQDDSFAHFYLGRVELDSRQYERAFVELRQSGLDLPTNPGFVFAAATGYTAIGRLDDARATLRRLDPHSLSAAESVKAASLLASLGQPDKAVEILRGLDLRRAGSKATDPPPWLRFDIALVHLTAGNNSAAIKQVAPLTQTAQPDSPSGHLLAQDQAAPAWSLLGIAQARRGDTEAAVSALHRAATLAPRQEEHWLNLTRELMELSRLPETIAATHQAVAAIPQSYALHLRLGAACLAAGHYADAEAVFRELTTAGDPLPTSYIGLAQVLLRTGHADEAVAELAAAHDKLGPTFLISYFQGLSLNRVNRRPEAVTAFQEAINLNPRSAEAHLGLGQSELALGHIPAAISELEQAHRLSPGDLPTMRLLNQARSRLANANTAPPQPAPDPTSDTAADRLGDFFFPEWQLPPTSPPP